MELRHLCANKADGCLGLQPGDEDVARTLQRSSESFFAFHEPFLLPLSGSIRPQSQVYPQQDSGAARISEGVAFAVMDHTMLPYQLVKPVIDWCRQSQDLHCSTAGKPLRCPTF